MFCFKVILILSTKCNCYIHFRISLDALVTSTFFHLVRTSLNSGVENLGHNVNETVTFGPQVCESLDT